MEGSAVSPTVIDVYADPICPWCFIGKRRLDRALARLPAPAPEVRWMAFQLNPMMPLDGMDRGAYLSAKFGSPERAREIYAHIRAEGREQGIDFAFDRIARTPNTVAAHGLIRYASESGAAPDMVEALFAAYFLDGHDIGSVDVLVRLAELVGLGAEAARQRIESLADAEAIRADDLAARAAGIRGVPHFIIDGRFSITGAQSAEVLLRACELAAAMHVPRAATT